MKARTLFLIFLLTVCAGCSSSPPPESHEYLLRPQVSSATYASESVVALGRIEIAPYLDKQGIVLETSAGQIDTATHNRWAEPLDFAIRRYLQVSLSQDTGQNIASTFESSSETKTQVDVYVHQLHGSVTGTVKIVAEWQIRDADSGDVIAAGQYAATETIAGDGYGEIVKAHSTLLDQLASAIASEL